MIFSLIRENLWMYIQIYVLFMIMDIVHSICNKHIWIKRRLRLSARQNAYFLLGFYFIV